MPWYDKETPTPFDNLEIPGLYFLIGDIFANRYKLDMFKGKKYPEIQFPSGQEFTIWEGVDSPIIHIFGEMDLAFDSTRDEAFELANNIAEACGYLARKVGDNRIEVIGRDDGEYFRLSFDNEQKHILDIERIIDEPQPEVVHPAHQLMPDEVKEKLPPLYANEHLGMEAVAQVKYFSPTSSWTWYATEYDGEDICYGLVVGDYIELGYFSISELQSVGGGLVLPIERDLYYEPKTLAELKAWHEKN